MAVKETPRWSWLNLAEFCGGESDSIMANRMGVRQSTICRWRSQEKMFTDLMADTYACRIGCHPWEIWPEWFD